MATESVSTQRKPEPSLEELIQFHGFSDPERARAIADALHDPIVGGIEAVGDLLWWAAQHDDFGEMGALTVTRAGLLLKELARFADHANHIRANAEQELRQRAA